MGGIRNDRGIDAMMAAVSAIERGRILLVGRQGGKRSLRVEPGPSRQERDPEIENHLKYRQLGSSG
jgi:hypothetical protein